MYSPDCENLIFKWYPPMKQLRALIIQGWHYSCFFFQVIHPIFHMILPQFFQSYDVHNWRTTVLYTYMITNNCIINLHVLWYPQWYLHFFSFNELAINPFTSSWNIPLIDLNVNHLNSASTLRFQRGHFETHLQWWLPQNCPPGLEGRRGGSKAGGDGLLSLLHEMLNHVYYYLDR